MEQVSSANQVIPMTLSDGLVVEAVSYGSGTVCISTQVGCAVRCPFCASGSKGFFRNLSLQEVTEQIEIACGETLPARLTLSGIGEPLHNWAVTKTLISTHTLPVSVTTTGAPLPRFRELLHLPHNGVMLSLHSAIAATHRKLVPKGPDLDALLQLLQDEWLSISRNKRRKLGVNYLLIEGVNDSKEEILGMAALMKQFPEATLHLLLCNPVAHAVYQSPPDERVQEIYHFFRGQDIHCRRANHWRRREDGGCGTLMVRGLSQGR